MDYKKSQTIDDLGREVKKAIKKVEVNYVREVIAFFLRRVYCVEKNNGELILNEFN